MYGDYFSVKQEKTPTEHILTHKKGTRGRGKGKASILYIKSQVAMWNWGTVCGFINTEVKEILWN